MARQDEVRRWTSETRSAEIPDKLCFRIGEVARICAVPSYVLRFWEREFPQLRPAKGGTGQRLYRRHDVEMALRVRRLLYEEGYTIPGARQWMREGGRAAVVDVEAEGSAGDDVAAGDGRLRQMRAELEEIVQLLARGERRPTAEVTRKRRASGRHADGVEASSMPLFALLEGSAEEERGR